MDTATGNHLVFSIGFGQLNINTAGGECIDHGIGLRGQPGQGTGDGADDQQGQGQHQCQTFLLHVVYLLS